MSGYPFQPGPTRLERFWFGIKLTLLVVGAAALGHLLGVLVALPEVTP